MVHERIRRTMSGWIALPLLLAASIGLVWLLVYTISEAEASRADVPPLVVLGCIAGLVFTGVLYFGFFIINPNEARVLTLFGRYAGSVKQDGFHWANPLLTKRKITLRIRNFESSKLKVNDLEGNPIEIAAVVVWRVFETAEALFEVDNYEHYVKVQTEAAVRNLATQYPYDAHVDNQMSLRGNQAEVAEQMKTEVIGRLSKAGVEVLEARINHLAYSPEIAAAMLQRQQAGAIIAARSRIVEGAVGMVEMALDMISVRGVVELDNERKAAMVSNLLVVLCGNTGAQPILNAGTIYQ